VSCCVCAWCLCLYKNEVNTVAVFFSMPCGALCAFSFDVGNIILVRFLSDHSVELAVSGPQRIDCCMCMHISVPVKQQ